MRKARIENNRVAEILTADPFPPFHPDLVWIECDATVKEGWDYDGTNFTAPPGPTVAEAQAAALVRLKASARAYLEQGGWDDIRRENANDDFYSPQSINDAWRTDRGLVVDVCNGYEDAIDLAADAAAVDAIMNAITWPAITGYEGAKKNAS